MAPSAGHRRQYVVHSAYGSRFHFRSSGPVDV